MAIPPTTPFEHSDCMSERQDIPAADPNVAFKARIDRALSELEAAIAASPVITPLQVETLMNIADNV